MIILWKRFVAWVIESKNDPFTKVRLKLTAIYLVIIVGIIISYLFLLNNEYKRITHEFAVAAIPDQIRRTRFINRAIRVSTDTLFSIQFEDILMLLITIFISYFLAGLALKPLKKTMNNQKQFLTDLSHELRTPLSVIKLELETYLQSVKTTSKGDLLLRKRADIESNIEEIDRMSKLLHNLLLIARLDSYQEKFQFLPTNLQTLIGRTVKLMKSTMSTGSIKFIIHISEDIVIYADGHKLQQVCINLLDNAIKNSPVNGKIRIDVQRDGSFAKIIFRDNGRGIDPKELPFIFDRFYKAKNTLKTKFAGSGLGLAISQIIIKRHNGTITIQSIPQRGTSVIIRLPLNHL